MMCSASVVLPDGFRPEDLDDAAARNAAAAEGDVELREPVGMLAMTATASFWPTLASEKRGGTGCGMASTTSASAGSVSCATATRSSAS